MTENKITPRQMFSKAIKNNNFKVVKKLLNEKKVNPAGYRNSAITEASRYGYSEIVKLLLRDPRVDQTAYSFYSIKRACEDKHYKVVEVLIQDSKTNFSSITEEILYTNVYFKNKKLYSLLAKNKYFLETLKKFHLKEYNEMITKEIKNKIEQF